MTDRPLDPGEIAATLLRVRPDRDQRASQICAEVLLALVANDFEAPGSGQDPASPKLRRFALRSLVFGRNFLEGYDHELENTTMRTEQYGALLASGEDFQGASNLQLARSALLNLVDPSTQTGAEQGQYLLMPFHKSLLWYDARRSGSRFTVRKVRMRGTGLTLARILLDPPSGASGAARERASHAIEGIAEALSIESPLSAVATGLEEVLPNDLHAVDALEDDERKSWELGGDQSMVSLAERLCAHAEGVSKQGEASGPSRLWQLRSVLALDLAIHMVERCWEAIDVPADQRQLLMALPGPDRQLDRVRLRSERSWNDAQSAINWATTRTIESELRRLESTGGVRWDEVLSPRAVKRLSETVKQPYEAGSRDFQKLAQLAFENADYGRAGAGFRVLLETIGMTAGGTRYRYISATPDLLAALVGALSREMPMTSEAFFTRVRDEWGIVISPLAAAGTSVAGDLDGDELAVNVRRFERVLIESGLAAGLSDRTVMVGERAGRRSRL
jgi:hypothetical protein